MTASDFRVAAVQATPVFLDRGATVDRAVALIGEAAAAGAGLVVFPEAFVPGYPDWVWRTTPWGGPSAALHARLVAQGVEIPGPDVDRLAQAASEAGTFVAIGVNERSPTGGTLYNSMLYLGSDGSTLGVHRKLIPTGGERLVWGRGSGSDLVRFDTPGGGVGGLICWENYMPLARAAMYAGGVDIWLAPTWDSTEVWIPTLRHIAREGRCYVIGTNTYMTGADVTGAGLGTEELYGGTDDVVNPGNACIVGPNGTVVAGPLTGSTGILYADIDATWLAKSRMQFDVCGHYSRPDVFHLEVDRSPPPSGS